MSKQSRYLSLSIAFLLGLASAISTAGQLRYTAVPLALQLLRFLGFWGIGSLVAYALFKTVIQPSSVLISPKIRRRWLALCLLAGGYLVFAIPITVDPQDHILKIVATGEKNSDAQGSEIWLGNIYPAEDAPPAEITHLCLSGWEVRENSLASILDQPSELTCIIKTDGPSILVRLGMHPWAGKARLVLDGYSTEVDLFSAAGDSKVVELPVEPGPAWLILVSFISLGVSLGFLLWVISLGLMAYGARPAPLPQHSSKSWLRYALVLAIPWFTYLLAFWPGFLSPDPLGQFGQIVTGALNDWHPAFHTMTLWLFTRLWFSPAPVIIAQIVVLAGLVGWGLSQIENDGASSALTWSAAILLAFSPAISLMLINPWKDIPYALSLVALTILFHKILISSGDWLARPASWVSLGIVAALTALYRHNGVPVAIGSIVILLFSYPKKIKSVLAVGFVFLVLWAGVRGPLYRIVGVETSVEAQGSNLGIVARYALLVNLHARSGTDFLPAEEPLIQRSLTREFLADHAQELQQLALQLTVRNPLITLDFILNIFDYPLQIIQPSVARIGHVEPTVYENPYGIVPDPKLSALQPYLIDIFEITEEPIWEWFFWRNAFWMYLLIFAASIACIRRSSWKYLLITVPVLLNALPLPVGSGGHIARYILATLIISPMFSGYLLTISRQPHPPEPGLQSE